MKNRSSSLRINRNPWKIPKVRKLKIPKNFGKFTVEKDGTIILEPSPEGIRFLSREARKLGVTVQELFDTAISCGLKNLTARN